ncbi:HNH endonuclease [Ralstonia syzygii subsp. celebesensis]|uniref:HNH endonuclease n=2 Tax=Ralstonia syzygii subsp. celebesensis TaxID=1310168 RepID=A0A1U9VGA9_9RALS|nr:HNH endonuclease signature motif containing protein [Ralstonia syzygii]AQW29111.1 HNH endonuclease [blood disease bacterium A2-HR MARDI]QQV54346.1 HNH endonuclease [Ralstonia syzygii subsp. celebesensis]
MARRPWTETELELLRQRYSDSRAEDIAQAVGRPVRVVYNKARQLGLKKSAEFYASQLSGRLDGMRGMTECFAKGHTPWNKGVKGSTGFHPNCVRTQFKKGEKHGSAQHNYVPIGSERINKDGYLERKVTDDPKLAPARRWVGVHRLVWEAARGPIPEGHVVCFLPGRRSTDVNLITINALELVHRAELARRNHPKNKSPDLWRLVQLKGAITRQVNRIAREAREKQS